ncbi:hypothetical protein C3432_01940 [Citrobacter amalonaticus]|uniref:Uncharacterized protein n=1 Tax=Citrobacter amalonaticus TaxID=35703 RepID=A0A2S4S2L9_CITAM|nr:hypothetical protein [Citrobacter amalonaticus]POT59507.1 hypothetical protein C3432_01940 [Citrobacter amalonaticus]POT77637.1 hypothetical protein C3436_09610 [Citrobacter amalonaticus]POU68089.1 hypothetical protein C3430_03145 [Citrobacter amalonaticus]POV07693.1 hypothetical protein C3424_03155 [Citrobacter amalonaticus]
MNDDDAAFRQQFEKLYDGGQLQLECCGMVMWVSSVHGMYMALVETWISPDRFYDFIQAKQYDLQENEQYLVYHNKVYYCLFIKNIDFSNLMNCAYTAVKCSMAYQ